MLYKIENLSKRYKLGKVTVNAVNNISLDIEGGKFYTLIGPSGSGKSTLLNIMGLLDEPSEGKIFFDGKDISKLSDDMKCEIRNENIGFIFQKYYLIPVLNVYENIEIPLLQNRKISKGERKDRIEQIIEEVGMKDYIKHKPNELSGGQQQRVAIARGLIMNPKVILADEPTANLDSKNSEEIIELMRKINKKNKTTFIFSTHDSLVMKYSDIIIKGKDGVFIKDVGENKCLV